MCILSIFQPPNLSIVCVSSFIWQLRYIEHCLEYYLYIAYYTLLLIIVKNYYGYALVTEILFDNGIKNFFCL